MTRRPLPSETERPWAAQRGYGYRWQQARRSHLAEHPLCEACRDAGRVTEATVVDHRTPHKGDPTLFWDRANWCSLCASCHSAKTVRDDGGFGRPVKDEGRSQ